MNQLAAVEGAGLHRVLVLHGWALDSGVWLASRALTDQAQFCYAYFDFPGYGVNRRQAPAASLDEMAAAALAAADSLGWSSFSVVGHSMGGATAMRVATMAPQRVRSVVAVTPVSAGGTPLDADAYVHFQSAWADPATRIVKTLSPGIAPVDLRNLSARNRATMNQVVWDAYLANWTAASFLTELKHYDGPVELLYGEDDPFVTPAYLSSTIAALPRHNLRCIAKAGHYPMVEQPASTVGLWEAALATSAR